MYRSTSNAGTGIQLLVPAPTTTNGPATTTPAKVDPKMDLLSGDGFDSPSAANALAIVPVGDLQSTNPVANQQDALVLVDPFSLGNNNQPVSPVGQAYPSKPQYQQQQNFQPPQTSVYPNGIGPNMMVPQYEQPPLPVYGTLLIHSICNLFSCSKILYTCIEILQSLYASSLGS